MVRLKRALFADTEGECDVAEQLLQASRWTVEGRGEVLSKQAFVPGREIKSFSVPHLPLRAFLHLVFVVYS